MSDLSSEGNIIKQNLDDLYKEINRLGRFYDKAVVETIKLQNRMSKRDYAKLGMAEYRRDKDKLDTLTDKTLEQSRAIDNLVVQTEEDTDALIVLVEQAFAQYNSTENAEEKKELLQFIQETRSFLEDKVTKSDLEKIRKPQAVSRREAEPRVGDYSPPEEKVEVVEIDEVVEPDFEYIIESDFERAVVPTLIKNIKIFNPKDEPFGKLSNLAYYPIIFDTKPPINCKGHLKNQYKTVSNYVYSSMLKTPSYKQSVACSRTDKIYSKFVDFYNNEQENVVKDSVKESNDVKFLDQRLKQLLLSTGKKPLFYISNNTTLGVNPQTGKGDNYLGKYLEKLRVRLREKPVSNLPDKLYQSYLVLQFVEDQYLEGEDVFAFANFTLPDVRNYIQEKGLTQQKYSQYLREDESLKKSLVELYEFGQLNEVANLADNKNILIPLVIQKNIDRKMKLMVDRLIVKSYIRDKINEFVDDPNEFNMLLGDEQEKQVNDIYKSLSDSQKMSILRAYRSGDLNASTVSAINEAIESSRSKMTDEIDISKQRIEMVENKKVRDSSTVDEPSYDNEPIYFSSNINNKYQVFSPNVFTGMLEIGSKLYPNPSYYSVAKLLTLIPEIRNLKNAYPYLLKDPSSADIKYQSLNSFLPLDEATSNYLRVKDGSYRDNLRKYAKIAMDEKFQDDQFKELLLLTGNSNITYNDLQDNILGIGKDKNGENFVGKYLMQIRNSTFADYNTAKYPILSLEDINQIYEYKYVSNWFEMKAKDMIFSLKLVRDFLNDQYLEQFGRKCRTRKGGDCFNIEVDYKLNHKIMEVIYKFCKPINKQYKMAVPKKFSEFVKRNMKNPSKNVIKQLWDRILSQFETVMETVPVFTLFTFKQFTVLNSLKLSLAKCENDCIASALDNTIEDLHTILKKITKIDVFNDLNTKYATLLILGSKNKRKKNKFDDIEESTIEEVGAQESKVGEILDEFREAEVDDLLEDVDYAEELEFEDSGVLSKTETFYESMVEIKTAKIPQTTKNNRIRYFATIKNN